ncbi:MAG: hypothetical protein QOK02_64, partial [Mycobacterium sp.]|nr:hypothetical protein [Mycobacterium sp.]
HGDRNLVCSCPAPEAFDIQAVSPIGDFEEAFA